MAITVQVFDESTMGERVSALTLDFLTETVTGRELIRSRVYQEVQDFNLRNTNVPFRGLVQPSQQERLLNPARATRSKEIDWKAQFEIAIEAFEKCAIIVLVDDVQVERLDQEIELKAGSQVSFLKLIPLVGG